MKGSVFMCYPASHIEADETTVDVDTDISSAPFAKDGKKRLLFVTGKELATEKGQKLVKEGAHLQGHDIIRKYYGIKGTFVEKEADLSDPDNIPEALADAIRKGEFVGVWTSNELLSDKGQEAFAKASEKIASAKAEPEGGRYYATTEAFWKIFKASAANRVENWK
jgi:hypothetical protein